MTEGVSLHHQYPFIHLRTHTAYSLLEGALPVKEYAKLLADSKMPAGAITDTNNLFGALEFSYTLMDRGIQPIIGCLVHIVQPVEKTPTTLIKQVQKDTQGLQVDELILLVQSEAGYQNLLKLMTSAYLERGSGTSPHIAFEDLAHPDATKGLIALTGGIKGGVGRCLLKKDPEGAQAYLEKLAIFFKDRLYIEIQRHGLEDEEEIESELIKLAHDNGMPLIATNDVFFATRGMYKAHDALLCVADGTYVDNDNRRRCTPEHYLKSSEEMAALFADLPEAYINTSVVAQRCSFWPKSAKPILPPFATESGRGEDAELREMAQVGLKRRLENQVYKYTSTQETPEEIAKKYLSRLEFELNVIVQMGYPGYFLIVADFIQWAKAQGIPVGPGRGSGAGSLVAWALTITDVDPIKQNLIFERFLNPERVSMPDFDIDFCQDRREEVIRYVQEKYGQDRVAQIITFGKLQARAVIRDVGRVLGLPYGQVDKISKLIPNNPANPITLRDAIDQEAELQQMRDGDPQVKELMEIAVQLEGLYRHASTHAAGLVIGDRPLDTLVPLYRDPKSETPVTQFSMKYVEQAGLVKFDFLGLKTLTILEDAAKLVRKRGIDIDISQIPLDDPKTFALLNRVETHGLFQIESAGMTDVLGQLKPDRFEELVALVALYRPGPMDDIPRYLACKHGHEPVDFGHPLLEDILKETFGVMVYQEQVMQIAQVMGGYTLGAADLLRRAMGKKIKSEMDAQEEIFLKGAAEKGIPSNVAHDIFAQMAKFAGYGFNKSHSAPYALISYQTAYFKANYPVEFFASTLTHDRNNTDKIHDTCRELKSMGIPVLPPDINESDVYFKAVYVEDKPHAIRYGLSAIKSAGEGSIEKIIEERIKNGPYKDIFDFAKRHSTKVVNRRLIEKLITSGTFDSLHQNRRWLFDNVETFIKISNDAHAKKSAAQNLLFDAPISNGYSYESETVSVDEWPFLEKLQYEFEAIGFYLSTHPLTETISGLRKAGVALAAELKSKSDAHDGKVIKFAGVITGIQKKIARSGNPFAFLKLSDPTGVLEVTVFSEQLQRSKDLLVEGKHVVLSVLFRQDGDTIRLTCQTIDPLNKLWAGVEQEVHITLENKQALKSLSQKLSTYTDMGKTRLVVRVPTELPKSLQVSLDPSHTEIEISRKLALPPDFSV